MFKARKWRQTDVQNELHSSAHNTGGASFLLLLELLSEDQTCHVSDIDDCSPNPCVHGNCTDQVNGYQCTCDGGYEGTNCDSGRTLLIYSYNLRCLLAHYVCMRACLRHVCVCVCVSVCVCVCLCDYVQRRGAGIEYFCTNTLCIWICSFVLSLPQPYCSCFTLMHAHRHTHTDRQLDR